VNRSTGILQGARYISVVILGRSLVRVLVAVAVVAGSAGCSRSGASFDPASRCTTDGRFAGAYPTLEALLPSTLDGKRPDRVDSGRNCTAAALGTLVEHGVTELRFAGGVWERGSRSGTTLVVFEATALDAAWLAEFYEAGARAARKTEAIHTTDVEVSGALGRRLDTLNDDSYQTVVVWNGRGLIVAALIASDVREAGTRVTHEAAVAKALAAFGPAG
jgi:hypothetical protein